MRVKISYSAELDDIPQEVSDLLRKAYSSLESATRDVLLLRDKLESSQETPDVSDIINTWPDIRKKLYKADSLLMDTSHMMSGYYATKITTANDIRENSIEDTDDTQG